MTISKPIKAIYLKADFFLFQIKKAIKEVEDPSKLSKDQHNFFFVKNGHLTKFSAIFHY